MDEPDTVASLYHRGGRSLGRVTLPRAGPLREHRDRETRAPGPSARAWRRAYASSESESRANHATQPRISQAGAAAGCGFRFGSSRPRARGMKTACVIARRSFLGLAGPQALPAERLSNHL